MSTHMTRKQQHVGEKKTLVMERERERDFVGLRLIEGVWGTLFSQFD